MSIARAMPGAEHLHVVVVGAGVAGTAAAIAASRAGARVAVLDGGAGASALATGAIDLVPWQRAFGPPAVLPEPVRLALEVLGGYVVQDNAALVLTSAGIVRPARGRDAALLDAAQLTGRRIGVVRCHRPGWDADALSRSWGDAFEPFDAVILRYLDEREIPDADFAARHDDDARVGWLADRLREALASSKRTVDALVLPPSLGVQQARAQVLSRRTGVPCGEALAMPGGPAGLRFENARDRALASEGVSRSRARAKGTKRTESRWLVATEEGATLEADAVVLATGGLLGGGLEYFPSESMPAAALPPCARTPLRFTLDAPLIVGENGLPLELPGSLFGVAPESLAWPFSRDALLERAGVLVDADGRVRAFGDGPRGLFASGELVADTARTWLAAFSSGVRAGAAAAREALGERDGAVSAPRGAESEPPPSPFAGPASRP